MRRPLAAAALAAAAVATGAAGPGGDEAAALDLRTASGPALATSAAEGNLGVLRGRAGHRRAGAFLVGTPGMSPTLGIGDAVLYDRTAYRATPPVRGDVVVLQPTSAQAEVCDSSAPRIARVVGVPGDVVTLDGFGVSVNGAPLVIAGAGRPQLNRTFPAVPKGRVLVLGDNRRIACDSASWHPPFVAVDAIRGRAEGVFHPMAHAGLLRRDGGLDRLDPDPSGRARLDAFMTAGVGSQSVAGALFGLAFCQIIAPLCEPPIARRLAVNEIRRQRGRLRSALTTLRGDCAAPPLRRLERRLVRDERALARGRVPLRRIEHRLAYHYTTGLSGITACWRVSIAVQRELALR